MAGITEPDVQRYSAHGMPRKFFRKYLLSHATVKQNRHVARFGAFPHHPNLWHLQALFTTLYTNPASSGQEN